MPKLIDQSKKDKRLGLAFNAEQFENLNTLATIERLPLAVLARKIIVEYLDARAGVIQEARKADADYQNSLEQIRNQYPR